MRPHPIVEKPRVGFLVQRNAVREYRRQCSQGSPKILQVEMEVEVGAKQQERRNEEKADDGDTPVDER